MSADVESQADAYIRRVCQEVASDESEELDKILAQLHFADALRRSAERFSHVTADQAREQGASWRAIGTAVGGITPQGAEHRFSSAAKERRSKAAKLEWASKERRRTPRTEPSEDRSYADERN